jgi:hypothetical protein
MVKGDNGHGHQVLRANARPVSRWVKALAVVLGIAAGTWGAGAVAQTAPKQTADQAGKALGRWSLDLSQSAAQQLKNGIPVRRRTR